MKGKVFILEDDTSICGLIKVSLEMNGIAFAAYSTVKDFYAALLKETPDIALLDVMLPDGNGFEVLKTVKQKYPAVCCIMLSAMVREEDKVNGLNLGADDYIGKPFSVLELTARVNAALRRKLHGPEIIRAAGVEIDPAKMTAALDGVPLTLNRKEFELLKFFVLNEGRVLTREQLLTEVWGYDAGETRTLDNHVSRLRKLGIKIDTVFGVGYRLS